MSTVLDDKVTVVASQTATLQATVQTAITLIGQLRQDIATGSVDNPATLAALDTISSGLTQSNTDLTTAVTPV